MFGHIVGPNDDGKVEVGKFVLGRTVEDVERAKRKLDHQVFAPQSIDTAPHNGTWVLVFFPIRPWDSGPLAIIPAAFMEGAWFARGFDLPQPVYWLPRSALPKWPIDPNGVPGDEDPSV